MYQQPNDFEGAKIEIPASTYPTVLPSTILKEIRSWAVTLLILGALSIFASGVLSAPWGVMLIIVGLASFYFRSSAVMVVYGVTLAWAGVTNLISGQGFWIGFAILQGYLVFRVFQKFISFRQAELSLGEQDSDPNGLTPKRSANVFPWVSGLLGFFSLLGFVGIFVGMVIFIVVTKSQVVPQFVIFLEGLIVNFGVLGFAVGLASILSKHPRKIVAIVGMVTGVLTLLIEFILRFI